MDNRCRKLTGIIHETCVPQGHEPPHGGKVDLIERAIARPVVPHAMGEHIIQSARIVDEFCIRLGQTQSRDRYDEGRQYPDIPHL